MNAILVTGPVASGKSRFAEGLARASAQPVVYLATSGDDPSDAAWQRRIEAHRRRRPAHWRLVETFRQQDDLVAAIDALAPECTALVDSLGTWIAQRIVVTHARLHDDPAALEHTLDHDARDLLAALARTRARVILVGEETGWGIVPLVPSARIFRDVMGRLHQAIALRASHAYLVVAGFAVDLTATGIPLSDEGEAP